MNEIKIYQNEDFGKVRTITDENGEVWFCAKDVCDALGYSNAPKAVLMHIEKGDITKWDTPTISGNQEMLYVNESGLYSLIMGSKLPKAKEFKHWITHEVLPSIRKHGMYATDVTLENLLNDPDFAIATFKRLKEERDLRLMYEKQLQEQESQVVFAMAVQASEDSILMRDLAKVLKQNGIDTGQNRLFATLRKEGFLLSDNTPSQRSMDMGLFEIKETAITMPNGKIKVNRTSKVTGKGQLYFVNKFLKTN